MMLLEITSIADRGNREKERLVMKATSDVDVGDYAIFRSRVNATGAPTTDISDVFWFPDKHVKSGDLVILYSKAGKTSERPQDSGWTAHFYYWGKNNALWQPDVNFAPVILYTAEWEIFSEETVARPKIIDAEKA